MYSNHYFHYYNRIFAVNHVKSLRHNGIKACIRKTYQEQYNDITDNWNNDNWTDVPVWTIYTKNSYLEVLKYLQFLKDAKK